MQLARFEEMVRRLSRDVPGHFFDGVLEVVVSPRTVPHPTRAEIYTLGECVPLAAEDTRDPVQSRIVLYHGSFRALAAIDPDFDWRDEAWETLTHELRHHLEWRAHAPDLERLDDAAEENFARQDGEPFAPDFHLHGEQVAEGVYRIEDDWFLDRVVRAPPAGTIELAWHGSRYRAPAPPGLTLPAFLTIEGVAEPPPGELVLVLRRKPRLRDLFRGPGIFQATLTVTASPS